MTRLCLVLGWALAACGPPSPTDAGSSDTPSPSDVPVTLLDANAAVGDWVSFDPAAPGPFAVGYRSFEHSYTPPGRTEARTILINIWYPTLASSGAAARYSGLMNDRNAFVDAPLAPSIYEGGRYPVHVYSHGDRGYGGTSAFLMRRFASHGWVAVAPDHTGNTLADNLSPRPAWMYYVRSTDLIEALDAMEALPGSDPLAGRLALDRVVASGHSYGVHTMWASAGATFEPSVATTCVGDGTCTRAEGDVFDAGVRDPRIVAIIPMAGAINRTYFGAMGHTSVSIPILSVTGTADPVGQEAQYTSTAPLPMTWIDVEGACHQFFALGCTGDADGDEDRIIGGFALAFARTHVLADTSTASAEVLDFTRVLSDRVHGMRR